MFAAMSYNMQREYWHNGIKYAAMPSRHKMMPIRRYYARDDAYALRFTPTLRCWIDAPLRCRCALLRYADYALLAEITMPTIDYHSRHHSEITFIDDLITITADA